jgi:hypothetical protein
MWADAHVTSWRRLCCEYRLTYINIDIITKYEVVTQKYGCIICVLIFWFNLFFQFVWTFDFRDQICSATRAYIKTYEEIIWFQNNENIQKGYIDLISPNGQFKVCLLLHVCAVCIKFLGKDCQYLIYKKTIRIGIMKNMMNSRYVFLIQSDLDIIVRGGRGYQISKNFPRITEVRAVKMLIKFCYLFTARVVVIGFGVWAT